MIDWQLAVVFAIELLAVGFLVRKLLGRLPRPRKPDVPVDRLVRKRQR